MQEFFARRFAFNALKRMFAIGTLISGRPPRTDQNNNTDPPLFVAFLDGTQHIRQTEVRNVSLVRVTLAGKSIHCGKVVSVR